MNILSGKATTHIRKKVNELVSGYNTNATNIATNTTNIAAINAGNIGEIVAAAGSTVADATALSATKFIHRVTGADATKGVKLPAGVAGMCHIVLNTVDAVLKVYPATGEEIENAGANTALDATALYGYVFTYVDAATGWETAKFLLVAS